MGEKCLNIKHFAGAVDINFSHAGGDILKHQITGVDMLKCLAGD